jgi:hypothetical protein
MSPILQTLANGSAYGYRSFAAAAAPAFESIKRFVVDTFSSWIAFGLSRSLSLDIKLTQQIRVVAAVYMLSMFTHGKGLDDESAREHILLQIPSTTYLPVNLVQDLLEIHPTPFYDLYRKDRPTITDLVNTITAISGALVKVDKATIYNSVCRGAIPVTNSTQIAAIGIEHPPTFVSMIESSLNSKTGLGMVLHTTMRRNDMEGFNRFIKIYVQDYKFQK